LVGKLRFLQGQNRNHIEAAELPLNERVASRKLNVIKVVYRYFLLVTLINGVIRARVTFVDLAAV